MISEDQRPLRFTILDQCYCGQKTNHYIIVVNALHLYFFWIGWLATYIILGIYNNLQMRI